MSALRVLGTLSAAALLAACGGSAPTAPSATVPSPTTTTTTTSAAPSASLPDTGTSTNATPTPSPTAPVHKAAKGEPALHPVSGFSYEDVGSDMNIARAMAAGMNKSHRGLATGYATHWVDSDRADTLLLAVVALNPKDHASHSLLLKTAKDGAASFSDGGKATFRTISGEKVAVASHADGDRRTTVYAWAPSNLLVYVVSVTPTGSTSEAAEAASFVKQYIAAQRS